MLPSLSPLDTMEDLDGYRSGFSDPNLWQPYVEWVCRRHGLAAPPPVRGGVPGTFPTFIAAERWVVKFFGRLFGGQEAFSVEQAVLSTLSIAEKITAPALVATGILREGSPGWPWPYLIMKYLPGEPLGKVLAGLPADEKIRIVEEIGRLVRVLHALPLPGGAEWQSGWEGYRQFLEAQRQAAPAQHRAWRSLPPHLLAELETFLGPIEGLIDFQCAPHLIHADLTGDHFLVRLENGQWRLRGLIDFGDARVGNLLYELPALHLDLFQGDSQLLDAFLAAYQPEMPIRKDFDVRALRMALLHQFDVLGPYFERYPLLKRAANLEELAAWVWEGKARLNQL